MRNMHLCGMKEFAKKRHMSILIMSNALYALKINLILFQSGKNALRSNDEQTKQPGNVV